MFGRIEKNEQSQKPRTGEVLAGPCYWCGVTAEKKRSNDTVFCSLCTEEEERLGPFAMMKKYPHYGEWINNLSLYKNRVVLETVPVREGEK